MSTEASSPPASSTDAYTRLLHLLDSSGARYRMIEHPEEGRTEIVSGYRGNPVEQAAKCLVVLVKVGKRTSKYFLAVVPGDRRVDLDELRVMVDGSYVAFASTDRAEQLAGSASGTILPFSFHPDLELVADPALLAHPELYFNAARLDRSLALTTEDYLRVAEPRVHRITAARQ